ncbi:hypothetical protein [Tunicatimonas pelagia]|nr:hypothetical protein [Tunicatimonas pelagia]WKN42062.1 hypothetical protein P0M28_23785 [Tunicatimonas pelagia]
MAFPIESMSYAKRTILLPGRSIDTFTNTWAQAQSVTCSSTVSAEY